MTAKKQRWVDSLPKGIVIPVDPRKDLPAALLHMSGRLYDQDEESECDQLAWAGALIRAHRKSLGSKSPRVSGFMDGSDHALILDAIRYVAWSMADEVSDNTAARYLRHAEMCLRTLWHRQQEAE